MHGARPHENVAAPNPPSSAATGDSALLGGRVAPAAAVVLALLFGVQVFTGSLDKSLTWDEPHYVAAGYANWVFDDYRLNADHPPLMQKLQALPLLWLPVEPPALASLD